MRKVELTMNENKKYEVIKRLHERGGNKTRAAVELGCSRRHINRMLSNYRRSGKASFSHGNKGRKPKTTIPDSQRRDILALYSNKYNGANHTHFTELLAKHEGIEISASSVRSILLSDGLLSPKAWKRTRTAAAKALKEEQETAKSKREKESIKAKITDIEDSHPTRPRCAHAGEMIQMDASPHVWFGDKTFHLHAAIDDATGIIVGAYFDEQETLKGYYHVFEQILKRYGIPYMFYTDRRTVFEYKKKDSPKLEKDTFTQFGYACKQLGVALKTTSVPQAKGRIERLFGTLQSRLPIEMKLAGVESVEHANEFLASYLKEFNSQFALPINDSTSVFEAQPEKEKIDLLLSVLTLRVIDSGHAIRFNNKKYRLLDKNGIRTDFYKGTKALVIRSFSGGLFCNIDDNIYKLEEIPPHEDVSLNFNTDDEIAEAKKPKKQYIPPMDHPWRQDNFMKYVKAMYGHETDWAS